MLSGLQISEAAGMALHTVGLLAGAPDVLISNAQVAQELNVSSHHLAKVHQRLVHAGIVRAVRGPSGGFQLAQPAENIKLIDVVQAVEGPFAPTPCLLGRNRCITDKCILGRMSAKINHQVREFLNNTTVAQLVY